MASADVARTSIVLFLALVVQHTLLDNVRVDGAHPEIMLMVAAAAGYVGGPERGAFVGFFTGLVADLLLPTTFGLSALVGCLLGFVTGAATSGLVRSSRALVVVVLTAAEVAGLVGFAVLGAVLGLQGAVTTALAPALVVATPAAAVLAVPVLAFVRWAVPPPLPAAATPPPAGLGR
jgi:rod shape-determining protein MreD